MGRSDGGDPEVASIQRAAIAKHRAEVARDEEAAKTRAAEAQAEQKAAAAVARSNRKAARDGSTGASGRREATDHLQAMVEDAKAEKAKRQKTIADCEARADDSMQTGLARGFLEWAGVPADPLDVGFVAAVATAQAAAAAAGGMATEAETAGEACAAADAAACAAAGAEAGAGAEAEAGAEAQAEAAGGAAAEAEAGACAEVEAGAEAQVAVVEKSRSGESAAAEAAPGLSMTKESRSAYGDTCLRGRTVYDAIYDCVDAGAKADTGCAGADGRATAAEATRSDDNAARADKTLGEAATKRVPANGVRGALRSAKRVRETDPTLGAARPPRHPSVFLPKATFAETKAQLEELGFSKAKAAGDGDCYILSVMAGFEIDAKAARRPVASTLALVREKGKCAVGVLAGDGAIEGIEASVYRASERLPQAAEDARALMNTWLGSDFWTRVEGDNFGTFMLSVALHLGRPVAMLHRRGRMFLNPVKVYGARGTNGRLVHSDPKPGAPATIPTFNLVSMVDLMKALRADPTSHSVIEFNNVNHFDPWILMQSVRCRVASTARIKPLTRAAQGPAPSPPASPPGSEDEDRGSESHTPGWQGQLLSAEAAQQAYLDWVNGPGPGGGAMSQPDPRLEAIVAAVLGDATHGTAAPAIVPATVPDALPAAAAAAPAMPPATAPATAPAVPPATAAHGGPPSLLPNSSASTSQLAPFPPPGYRRQGCLLLKDPPETWTPAGYLPVKSRRVKSRQE